MDDELFQNIKWAHNYITGCVDKGFENLHNKNKVIFFDNFVDKLITTVEQLQAWSKAWKESAKDERSWRLYYEKEIATLRKQLADEKKCRTERYRFNRWTWLRKRHDIY